MGTVAWERVVFPCTHFLSNDKSCCSHSARLKSIALANLIVLKSFGVREVKMIGLGSHGHVRNPKIVRMMTFRIVKKWLVQNEAEEFYGAFGPPIC